MRIVRIKHGKSLPFAVRFIFIGLICFLIFLIFNYLAPEFSIPTAMLVASLAPAFWFSTKIFIIDLEAKRLFKGFWSMGIRNGKWISFKSISFNIEKKKTKKTIYRLPDMGQVITDHEFISYVITDKGEKFYLFSHPEKDRSEQKLNSVKQKLGLAT